MADVINVSNWFSAASVRIGRLWVPGRDVEAILARYAKLIFCVTGLNEHPYSLVGSATAARIGNRCALFCCKHQISEFRPDEVTISVDKEGKTLVSGSNFVWINKDGINDEEEFLDLCAMVYDTPRYKEPSLRSGFFDLLSVDCWNGDRSSQFYVIGYPTSLRSVDYEIPHIDVKQIITSATYAGASHAANLHQIRMTRTATFSSDGLSGAPVFFISRDRNGFFVGLAGIVTRGSDTSDFLHFVDVRIVLQFFEKIASLNLVSD